MFRISMKKLEISGLLSGLEKRRKSRNAAAINYKTVGLIGLCSGAGTTQLGIMLANYFSNGLHLKKHEKCSKIQENAMKLSFICHRLFTLSL